MGYLHVADGSGAVGSARQIHYQVRQSLDPESFRKNNLYAYICYIYTYIYIIRLAVCKLNEVHPDLQFNFHL